MPHNELRLIDLGSAGKAHLNGFLASGGPLSRKALELSAGSKKVFALLEEGTELGRALMFEVGGLVSRRDAQIWLAEWFASQYGTSTYQLIIEDSWAKETDPEFMHRKSDGFVLGASVYYSFGPELLAAENICNAFKSPSSFRYAAFLISPAVELSDSWRYLSDEHRLSSLATNLKEALVTTYDAESFVIWQK
jgi:hypothetical protein